jgi:formate C-acetyltransferase
VGLANLADGLFVLNQEIFEQKRLSMSQLHAILAADFNGFEPERQRFLNRYPKYGNDHLEVDRLVGETVDFIRTECSGYSMEPDDSPYVPGAFCWVMHEVLGRQCGATPDGRRAGFPFADGCGPAQGRERSGPTAAVLSTTSWCASDLIGGAAFNMKFARSLFSNPQSIQRLKDLVLTFLQRGGFETQVNVVDAEVLRQAQAHPEEFRDLVVRIGGYTDYFTRLTPEMQAEVILRTEYSIP